MQAPLYQVKAEFFRMLGHPVRIRELELLQHGPVSVRDLLADIEIEPSSLSQQLAVLRRSGIVVSVREGSTVRYAPTGGDVAELLRPEPHSRLTNQGKFQRSELRTRNASGGSSISSYPRQ
ncbi:ArsR/SmtB family transcription factor [Streptomyces chartreusis]|uniref:ArsR/SmtB family transcription factor n=1 Tax=Streptomyces chartreusis TaxID=1969 RepID=UPI003806B6B2